jgi:lipopolysaccharide biosynthesis glycosyltransferase
MRAKIFVTYHKDTHLVNSGILAPIQVGTGPALPGCGYRDNTGQNISGRNDLYCEMTAAYWAWQNATDLDYIGLLHYRRFLNFRQTQLELDEWGTANYPSFSIDFTSRFGLNDSCISATLKDIDVLLPRRWNVGNAGFRNLQEHYARAPHHHEADLHRCLALITQTCPEYLQSWHGVMQSDSGWFNNMVVMRAELFRQYCAWVFPLLERLETQIPLRNYGTQERRVLGYLAERLLNVWLKQYMGTHPETKVKELDRVFIKDPRPKVWNPPQRSSQQQPISIVVASDDSYVPHLGALLVSIFDNLDRKATVDLLIMDGGISSNNQAMLRRLVPTSSSLHFLPMEDEFTAYFTHMHFSRATFYRLTLDRILTDRKKVLYIDCDTIVLGDLRELWDVDIGDKPIAAVHDYIMESFCHSKTLSADFTGSLPARTYLERYLGLSADVCDKYFQAGVLIMNLQKIRALGVGEAMVEALQTRKYWFLDQDVLNKYFCGLHANLPPEWNVITMIDEISSHLDAVKTQELEQARVNAKLIHYAGYEAKPWINPTAPQAHYYFQYLRRTFWYEEVMRITNTMQQPDNRQNQVPTQRIRHWRALRKIWRRLPVRVRQVANPAAYALRRQLLRG